MSLDFFRVDRGLQLDDTTTYLTGNGSPGTSSDTIAVVVGSVYTDQADGSIWTKILSGAGTDKWQKLASETYVNNALGATVSWREPAIVRNSVITTVPSGTAGSPVVVDGVSITDGGRVLFTAIAGGAGPNVYIYNQTTGAFVADSNTATSGDALYVQQGSDAGKTFIYNGTSWVQSDQSSLDEEGYIRAFIGKATTGNVMPTFTTNNFVVDGQSLRLAISALDAEFGANVALGNWISPSFTVNQNLQILDTKLGPNFGTTNHLLSLATSTVTANLAVLDGLFGPSLIAGSYVTAGQAAFPAIQALDIAIGPNVANGNFIFSANKVQQNIQSLDNEIGANVTNGGTVLASNTINQNIQALDSVVTAATKTTSVVNVTSATLIDAIPAATLDVTKFFVFVEEAANPGNRYATELYVLCDGTSVDYTKYATLRLGSSIVGLQVSAVVSGGNVSVQVASTAAVNVKVRRATVV
jgi:hypothetical protein